MDSKVPSKYSICDKESIRIRRLLLDLEWVQPKYKQKRAIRKLSKLRGDELSWLSHPYMHSSKSAWQNYARVLQKIGYPDIKSEIQALLSWLEDPNWPGAKEIYDLLLTVPNDVLLKNIETYMGDCPDEPYYNDDYMYVSSLVYEKGIIKEAFQNLNCYKILKYIHNY